MSNDTHFSVVVRMVEELWPLKGAQNPINAWATSTNWKKALHNSLTSQTGPCWEKNYVERRVQRII